MDGLADGRGACGGELARFESPPYTRFGAGGPAFLRCLCGRLWAKVGDDSRSLHSHLTAHPRCNTIVPIIAFLSSTCADALSVVGPFLPFPKPLEDFYQHPTIVRGRALSKYPWIHLQNVRNWLDWVRRDKASGVVPFTALAGHCAYQNESQRNMLRRLMRSKQES